ncbi:hypothetical protein ACT6QG_14475 [Xanthobacter sp. TB0136]|uniref:hypothetical protein n=1 Tax=Xanthobacter sp. TB0136 TaxID=3459177 RepID=UPI00403A632F
MIRKIPRVAWEVAGASWLALSALPLAHYGWNENGIISSFCVFIGIPTAIFMIYVLLNAILSALGPPALAILHLIILVYEFCRDTISAISKMFRGR